MYRYNRYITRHLVHSTLLITLSLTSIIWLTQALRFIDFMVTQGVSVAVFLTLTILLIPSLLLMILPPAFFCSVLFVYHRLAADSELVVMQAAGLSRWRLAQPAIQVGCGVMLVAYIVALYLQPVSYRQFRDMQLFLRHNYVSILLQEGVFSNPVEGLTVFIRERDENNTLRGILVHDNRQKKSSVTMMAEEGKLVETPQGPRFLMHKGNRQEIRDGKLSFLNFDNYTLDISLYDKTVLDRTPDARELWLTQLFTYDESVVPTENLKRLAEGHQRLLWPAYSVMLAVLGVAVLLSGEFNRRGHWQRIAMAVLFGVFTLFSAVGLRGAMAINPSIIPVAYLNLFVPAIVAGYVLGREKNGGFLSLPKRRKLA